MSLHILRSTSRLALVAAIGGTLAAGALAGPVMAATDPGADASLITVRKAGGGQPELTVRKAGGEGPETSIIAVL